ncbi:hypothetical protein P7K49_027964, partial [Saguinus oedipus]
ASSKQLLPPAKPPGLHGASTENPRAAAPSLRPSGNDPGSQRAHLPQCPWRPPQGPQETPPAPSVPTFLKVSLAPSSRPSGNAPGSQLVQRVPPSSECPSHPARGPQETICVSRGLP